MTFPALASVVGLILAPQASPNPASNGTKPSSGAKASGAANPRDAADLADVLSLMQSRSGGQQSGGGRFSPPGGTNVRVSSPSTKSQWMPAIAVDPDDRLHLIGAARDDRNFPGYQAIVLYSSFDGGQSWNELFHGASSGQDYWDPAVAFGPSSVVYCVVNWPYGDGSANSIGPSFDGGLTVPNWYFVDDASKYNDRPAIAVDHTTRAFAGNVYVAFDWLYPGELGPSDRGIAVATSSNGGQTSNAVFVNDSYVDSVSRPSIAVDSAGVVHVVWYDDALRVVASDLSSDGGATWGTDVSVAGTSSFAIPHLSTWVLPSPELAVDTSGGPFDGTLYVTWAQDGGAGVPDVVLSKSSDGGATWSTPIVVSDVTINSQFTPSITVDPQGNVLVGFYDRRDDPNDVRVSFYVARSSDGGVTFQRNVKVSDADFDPTGYATGPDIVTRTGIAASDQLVHAIWTDGRNGDNDIYTAPIALDFSTDVETLSASTGGTVNFTVSPGPLFQNDLYQIIGSTSGTTPGLDLFFVHLPLNFDPFFAWTIMLANGSSLRGFVGTLDATGTASGALVSGPLPPSLIGYQMDFAVVVEVGSAFHWASDATHLEIGN
jgi:hypothetical protein